MNRQNLLPFVWFHILKYNRVLATNELSTVTWIHLINRSYNRETVTLMVAWETAMLSPDIKCFIKQFMSYTKGMTTPKVYHCICQINFMVKYNFQRNFQNWRSFTTAPTSIIKTNKNFSPHQLWQTTIFHTSHSIRRSQK